ncbi:MAG: FHA domain-containing protein [Anaerolineales bacterium]
MSDLPGYLLLSLRFLLAIALYAFLGFAIWTIWQELKKTVQSTETNTIPAVTIEFANEEKRRFSYNSNEVVIGRAPQCDLHIMDETVSSRHGQLYFRLNQWWYEDLGSSNGSFLNQRPLKSATVLTDGDELQLGKIHLIVYFSK